jgi:hypothetical protein
VEEHTVSTTAKDLSQWRQIFIEALETNGH